MPATKKVTTAAQWKKATAGTEVTVPSGNVALLRRVDPRVFMKTGRIPNTLLKLVNQAIGGKEPDLEKMAEAAGEDPQMLLDVITMMDVIVVDAVIEPKLTPVPPDVLDEATGTMLPGPRDPDLLYVDEVDLDDKMFIMNWAVGGSSDIERFRDEQGANVGRVRAVAGDGGSTK